jgi:hypothetical protein
MAPMTDDRDIRQALADLTDRQPSVPPGRFTSVRRKAVRRRRRQAGGAVLAAVVIAGVVAGLTGLPAFGLHPQPSVRQVPGWALAWPDHRNGSVPQAVLDRAVIAAQYEGPNAQLAGNGEVAGPGEPASAVARKAAAFRVVWYVGQTMDHGQTVVVMFETDGPDGPQLVVGQANASNVMQDQAAWSQDVSPWALTVVTAPNPHRPPLAIGDYVAGSPAASGLNHSPDNWMVVLTAPDVIRLDWIVQTTSGWHRPSAATQNGLVVTDNGQITSAVELTGRTTERGFTRIASKPVGIPGNGPGTPQLAAPPPLVLPGSFSFSWGQQGQGSSFQDDNGFYRGTHQYAIYGICYGPEPVKITMNGHRIGSISCDSQQHEITVPAAALTGHGHDAMTAIYGSDLTSWHVEFGQQG